MKMHIFLKKCLIVYFYCPASSSSAAHPGFSIIPRALISPNVLLVLVIFMLLSNIVIDVRWYEQYSERVPSNAFSLSHYYKQAFEHGLYA